MTSSQPTLMVMLRLGRVRKLGFAYLYCFSCEGEDAYRVFLNTRQFDRVCTLLAIGRFIDETMIRRMFNELSLMNHGSIRILAKENNGNLPFT